MFYFIVNPTSGDGLGKNVWEEVRKRLEKEQVSYNYYVTEPQKGKLEKHLWNTVLKEDMYISAVVVVGGDGTINETINILQATSIPIGVIPAGTGNDFARANNIPNDCALALDRILQVNTGTIDLLHSNFGHFGNVIGVGFDAQVAELTNRSRLKHYMNKWKLGKHSYIINALRLFLTYKPSTVKINIDGSVKIIDDVWLIAVANSQFYGGGLKICPSARNSDGKLDICIISSKTKLKLLKLFYKVFMGSHIFEKEVMLLQGINISISSDVRLHIQGDGEVLGETPITISVKKNALFII
ncbi:MULTISPECIES: diacylglycerol/lipid kinase family protein [Sutcliffiella]|uniref:DAGKc domain-containing protein n=1 Tax=Sutcliffiella cohnii TaxID=33932 RepID=A0A223KR54_9BACI|nr:MULTISPECIES: diacylglycerol kinase family protein [Sutcliffiella]AST91867.1 hypothetical protein BC6307_11550 [Sutcliffiella cohnii]WBL13094.1 diacylglycerol kinase family lipid kinase [Sutcliffiella sp. NC1]